MPSLSESGNFLGVSVPYNGGLMRPASVLCLYVKFWQSRSPSNHQKIRQAIPNFTQIRHFFIPTPEFPVLQTFFMSEHALLRPNVEIISAKL